MTPHFTQPAETARSEDHEIIFDHYDPEDERRRESLLSLGNGVLHCRASAPEEGANHAHYPGLYRAGCYSRLTGQVEGTVVSTDSLANLPSWLHLAFRLEGEDNWLSFDLVELLRYRQKLDMKAALLTREVTFRDSRGRRTELTEERFISMAAVHTGALRVSLRPLNWSGRIEIRSGIACDVGNHLAVAEGGYDPHALKAGALSHGEEDCLVASVRTLGTDVDVAVAARHRVSIGPRQVAPMPKVDHGATQIAQFWKADLQQGDVLQVEKVGVTFTSRDHAIGSVPRAAVSAARSAPDYDVLRGAHMRAWTQLWGRCAIEIENENLSRAIALHGFHLLQTASPHASNSDAGLPSRGWQEAYHGHIFWDETLSLAFLSLHLPDVVRSILIYRYRRLDAARALAAKRGLAGALYPWRSGTIGFEETPEFQVNPRSGRWHRDDTRFQLHIGSAIAHNIWRYFLSTRDINFMAGYGTEMMVEIARMWASLAKPHPDHPHRFTIRGVVGPDEFHTRYPDADAPGLNDDTYTNIMAAWSLTLAAKALDCLPADHRDGLAARLKLERNETAHWQTVITGLHLVRDEQGLFLPFDNYEKLAPFDLQRHERQHPGERLDWFVEAQGRDINGLQVQKQATFAMLAHLLSLDELTELLERMGHPATVDQIRQTITTDLARTSHDSSLSNLIYAGALARVAPETSWKMFRDSLHPDEKAGHSGTEKGVHLGAMSATLDIVQRIQLGIRPGEEALIVDPAPHPHHGRIRSHVLFRSNSIVVEMKDGRIHILAYEGNHSAVPLLVLGVPHRLPPGKTYIAHLDAPRKEDADATDQGAAFRS
ncbi:glycoside hydrolase family 65 protein [Falsirhodobacter deserti]|uniref:glycoside hydrolase family 65 protein n=1 Tax=Falsirhodobacter deserti TaxID=1365611 RepID=UPI000FE3CF37|nr:glycoside hydrolase family 65 protein [Falsirhodobacter deserti]